MAALALKIVLFVLWTVGAYAVGYRQAKRGLPEFPTRPKV